MEPYSWAFVFVPLSFSVKAIRSVQIPSSHDVLVAGIRRWWSIAIYGVKLISLSARYSSFDAAMQLFFKNRWHGTRTTHSMKKPTSSSLAPGGAGLAAALRCHAHTLKSIIVEKTDLLGGLTAMSGGGMWIPNNIYQKAQGSHDSIERALTYMNHCIGDVGPASSYERRMSFLVNKPKMVDFLRECGFRGRASGKYPDYYPDAPGGDVFRCLEPAIFDMCKLGSYRQYIRSSVGWRPPLHSDEASRLFQYGTSMSNMLFAARIVGLRSIRRLLGQHPIGLGRSMISQLLHLNLQRNTSVIWRNSPITDLIVEDGRVIGAIINHDNKTLKRVRARRGVLLVAGGFAHHKEMREKYQEGPITSEWTSTSPGDQGDAIRLGQGINAQLALMDDAWWGPSVMTPGGKRHFLLFERALPFSIIVDQGGSRFMNEA